MSIVATALGRRPSLPALLTRSTTAAALGGHCSVRGAGVRGARGRGAKAELCAVTRPDDVGLCTRKSRARTTRLGPLCLCPTHILWPRCIPGLAPGRVLVRRAGPRSATLRRAAGTARRKRGVDKGFRRWSPAAQSRGAQPQRRGSHRAFGPGWTRRSGNPCSSSPSATTGCCVVRSPIRRQTSRFYAGWTTLYAEGPTG